MKKFQQNVSRELRRAYPDRRRLECQCLSAISFVKNEQDMLDSPIWVLIINVVAMDMLKSKLPPSKWFFVEPCFFPTHAPIIEGRSLYYNHSVVTCPAFSTHFRFLEHKLNMFTVRWIGPRGEGEMYLYHCSKILFYSFFFIIIILTVLTAVEVSLLYIIVFDIDKR